jgi:hypothetical protein
MWADAFPHLPSTTYHIPKVGNKQPAEGRTRRFPHLPPTTYDQLFPATSNLLSSFPPGDSEQDEEVPWNLSIASRL